MMNSRMPPTRVFYDISLPISPATIVWPGDSGVAFTPVSRVSAGDTASVTSLALGTHAGTHVDAPSHFLADGATVDTLDLQVLVGPAFVATIEGASALTAEALDRADIPADITRLLLRTDNTDRALLQQSVFHENFVAVTPDGAEWLVRRGIRLVGIDYLSIAPFDDGVEPHRILLSAGMIIVEGLDLRSVPTGHYEFVCLPLKLAGLDGAPARAILIGEG